MTTQIPDILMFQGETYQLLGDYTGQLPMFGKYGIEPVAFSTACWKGYVAHYSIEDEILNLSSLTVRDKNNHYPLIGGVTFNTGIFGIPRYEALNEIMNLSGQIVIGRDKVNRDYPEFQTVLRLSFDEGKLQSIEDISDEIAVIRRCLKKIWNERNSIWMRIFSSESKRQNHRKQELDYLYGQLRSLIHGTRTPSTNPE